VSLLLIDISTFELILFNGYSELLANNMLLNMKDPCNPTEGDWKIRNDAKNKFMDFIEKTYEELYKLESKKICGKSSISVFCRFDIGLIQNAQHINYFVNEVERTPTASLWMNPLKGASTFKSRIGLCGSTFANILYKWLQDTSNPYLI